MKIDVLIKNGHIVDPSRKMDAVGDIGIIHDKIVDIKGKDVEAVQVIDASGCYVFPGLIDFHTHSFFDGTNTSANPNFYPATGVTAAVDAGSSGCCNFPMFYKNIIINSAVRIKAFLSCYSMGLGGGKITENFDPALFDKVRIRNAKERFPNDILGLKMRLGHKLKAGIENLQAAVDIANEIEGMAVCVHVTDSPDSLEKVVKVLRKGDIMCHCFHGTGNTILDENGKIFDAVWEARERGVYFDQCNGKFNFSIDVSNAALAQGFLPDVISTDMGSDKLNYSPNVRSLPYVMSKYLSCGISLYDVIERTTQTPAKLMHMEGRIGTLAPGAFADVSIFTIEKRRVVHFDTFQKPFVGEHLMVPMMTVTGGQLAYAQAGFNLRETPITD